MFVEAYTTWEELMKYREGKPFNAWTKSGRVMCGRTDAVIHVSFPECAIEEFDQEKEIYKVRFAKSDARMAREEEDRCYRIELYVPKEKVKKLCSKPSELGFFLKDQFKLVLDDLVAGLMRKAWKEQEK